MGQYNLNRIFKPRHIAVEGAIEKAGTIGTALMRNLINGGFSGMLLPVLGLLLGAFSGLWASRAFGLTEISGSIGGALAGLGIGYAAVIILDRSPSIRRRIIPTVTAIVTPKVGISDVKKASCCG
jgi:hypothetical protein